jgi:hypothetical protein
VAYDAVPVKSPINVVAATVPAEPSINTFPKPASKLSATTRQFDCQAQSYFQL